MPKIPKKKIDVSELLKDRQIKKVVRAAQKAFKIYKKAKPFFPPIGTTKSKKQTIGELFRRSEYRKRLEDAQKGIFR